MPIWLVIETRSDDIPSQMRKVPKMQVDNDLGHATYLEWFGELFTGDEWVHSSLLRRPSFDRVQVE